MFRYDYKLTLTGLVLALFTLPLFVMSQQLMSPIDTTIIETADVTGDGTVDTVAFHIMAKNFKSPFHWTLSIQSNGQTIFYKAENDSDIDQFFNDEGYVGNCKGYKDCKKRWYFFEFVPLFLVNPKDFTKLNEKDIIQFAKPYLTDSCGVSPRQAKRIIHEIAVNVKSGRFTLLNYLPGPGYGPIWIFVSDLKRFIPIWDD
jgi:hypothetical protein